MKGGKMEEIYKEYAKKIYTYLLSLTNNEYIAEELLQETFYSAIKNINKFRNEASIKTWLYTIAKNKWIDYCKKNKKLLETPIYEKEQDILYSTSFEEDFLNKNELLDVCKQIHKLDEKSKEVVYLRLFTNFSFKEIANIIGKTEENTRIIFFRAKNKLKGDINHE